MNSSRLWALGSVVVIIALLVGTWFVGISPRLGEAAIANNEHATVVAQNSAHEVTLASLKKQFEGLGKLKTDLGSLRVAIPENDDTADLIRQLADAAASTGVTITSLTLAEPERFAPPAEPTSDAELAGALSSVSPDNFLVIPVDVAVAGPYSAVMAFLGSVQEGERIFLVHDLTMGTGIPAADTLVEVSFTGQVFALLENVSEVSAPGGESIPGGEPVME